MVKLRSPRLAWTRAGAGWRGPGVVECETEQRPVLSAAAAPLQLVDYYNAVVQIYKVRMIDGDRFKPMFRFCPSFRGETVTVISSCVRVSSAGARTLELTCVWLLVMVMCIFILCKFAAFEWSVWGV